VLVCVRTYPCIIYVYVCVYRYYLFLCICVHMSARCLRCMGWSVVISRLPFCECLRWYVCMYVYITNICTYTYIHIICVCMCINICFGSARVLCGSGVVIARLLYCEYLCVYVYLHISYENTYVYTCVDVYIYVIYMHVYVFIRLFVYLFT